MNKKHIINNKSASVKISNTPNFIFKFQFSFLNRLSIKLNKFNFFS